MTKKIYSFSLDEELVENIPFENRSKYVTLALINLRLDKLKEQS